MQYERAVFSADSPAEANAALRAKALCYEQAGLTQEALSTLGRVRLYYLDAAGRSEVLKEKSRYCRELERWSEALGYLEESGAAFSEPAVYAVLLAREGRYAEAHAAALACPGADPAALAALFARVPKEKKENWAAYLSFLPPLGQLYLGRPGEGALSVVENAAAVAFTVWQALDHCWITALLGGGLLLKETYMDRNIIRNVEAVEAVNAKRREVFVEELASQIPSLRSE